MEEYICRIKDVCKEFPGVKALKNISFDIKKGEIHAVIGENGAGKSTLMNILSGVYQPTSGEVEFDGKPVHFLDPKAAHAAGIGMVHQELSLAQYMTVAENIFQGHMPANKAGFIRRREINRKSLDILQKIGVKNISPDILIKYLSISQKQLVEIAKAMSLDAKLLIMDEPTSSLTVDEIDFLLGMMKNLRDSGVSILFITHKLEEVLSAADTISVMRDGEYITKLDPKKTNIQEMISYMVGRKEEKSYTRSFMTNVESKDVVMEVKNLTVPGKISNISFQLHRGEVLGLTGLVGAGRSELLNAIFGYYPNVQGKVLLEGKEVRIKHCKDAIDKGIALVPENRKELGLFLKMSVRDNMTIVHARQISGKVFMNVKSVESLAEKYREMLSIKTPNLEQKVVNLSGGNQQKTIIARWMMHQPKVLMMDEPTHGIDVGAKQEIYELIDSIAKEGISVILLSSELPEILRMSDRILIMHQGELRGTLDHSEATEVKIMEYIFDKETAEVS